MPSLGVDSITDAAGTGAPAFPNGVAGVTNGSVAVSGVIGEVIDGSYTSPTGGSTVSGVFTDSGASITLTPGDWQIIGMGTVEATVTTGTGVSGASGRLLLTDASNTIIIGGSGGFANSLNGYFITQISLVKNISISATTTYKLRFGWANNSSPVTVTNCQIDASSAEPIILVARRMR